MCQSSVSSYEALISIMASVVFLFALQSLEQSMKSSKNHREAHADLLQASAGLMKARVGVEPQRQA